MMSFTESFAQGFNSRTPGGVRQLRRTLRNSSSRFNSRTPGGVRLPTIWQ